MNVNVQCPYLRLRFSGQFRSSERVKLVNERARPIWGVLAAALALTELLILLLGVPG